MAEVFIRKWRVTIGFNGEVISKTLPNKIKEYPERSKEDGGILLYKDRYKTDTQNGSAGTYTDYTTIPPIKIVFEDPLQMTATVEDNKESKKTQVQKMTLRLFNLSEESRNTIKAKYSIFLEAGYEQDKDLPSIFVGQITSVRHIESKPNWITVIEADAADIVRSGAKITKSYPPNTTLKTLVTDLAYAIAVSGIPLGEINTLAKAESLMKKTYPFGYNVHGGLLQALETICDANGLKTYVTQGKLFVEPKNPGTELTKVVNVYPENFKGSLERQKDTKGDEKTSEEEDNDILLKLYLDGNITANSLVRLFVPGYEGDYTIKSLKFEMDYESGDWDTVLKISPVKR